MPINGKLHFACTYLGRLYMTNRFLDASHATNGLDDTVMDMEDVPRRLGEKSRRHAPPKGGNGSENSQQSRIITVEEMYFWEGILRRRPIAMSAARIAFESAVIGISSKIWVKESVVSTISSIPAMNRELAERVNAKVRRDPHSPCAGKFVGIANGQVVAVADSWREVSRRLREVPTKISLCPAA